MKKRYIDYYNNRIYAIYFRKSDIIYYNLNFVGRMQLIIYK